MDSRASTRTRLSVLPVAIALIFNLIVPVLSLAVPEAAPEVLQPQVAEAADDPAFVNFTLEGCNLDKGSYNEATLLCDDAAYTTGNLGKQWNELDLVPHRLTTSLGTQSDATETYTIGITADYLEAGAPGYDVITAPVLNAAKSHASCSIVAGPQTEITPGVGGTDTSLGRLLTITQDKGTTCVFDWVQRLALGSHLFPGASLHTNRTNQLWSTQGIGAADVSIPVNEILPQELDKTMSATRGQAYSWSIDKSADPTELDFANSCLTTPGALSQQVQITVEWTRSGPTASGDTTITTNIYATNPAHRSVQVTVTDRIYEGADQSVLLDTVTSAATSVPAGMSDMLILTHSIPYSGSATTFNDVATAVYVDEDLGIEVPGQTTATANATTQPSGGPIANASVMVTDTESITGAGLSFSVAAPSVGAFTGGYTAGLETTGPVGWQHTATNSGSVTFTKTVYVDAPMITSGTLSDTATVVGDGDAVLDSASADVDITVDAQVSLEISKTIPAGALRSGESVTFDFEIDGPDGFTDTASITFNYGDSLTKSTTLNSLAPGEYTVTELPLANWADHTPQTETITLPDCSGSVSFNNSTLAPDLDITKEADDDPVNAGDDIGFSIVVSNSDAAGTGVAKDVALNDPLPGSATLGVDWSVGAVLLNGVAVVDPSAYCEITGSAPAQTLVCDFDDMDPGDSAEVQVSSGTSAPDGCENLTLNNTAKAAASNHDEIEASDSITIECPALGIDKIADSATVSAGEDIGFIVEVENAGTAGVGTAANVTLKDPLPGNAALGVDWSVESVEINGVPALDPSDYCWITGDAPAQTLECEFGDMAPGDSASVHVTSGTSAPDGCLTAELPNQATADADNHAEITAEASITVECPDLAIVKTADDDVVSAGQDIGFTIEVSNSDAVGIGTAFDVTVEDALPGGDGIEWSVDSVEIDGVPALDPSDYCWITGDAPAQTLECEFGDMAPGATASVHVTSATTEDSCGQLENTAIANASNHEEISSLEVTITIECPGLNLVKDADDELIDAGEEASFTVTVWNAGPGTAFDVTLHDDLPAGLAWDFDVLQGTADCSIASSVVEGGLTQMSVDCDLGDLAPSAMEDGVIIRFFADTTRDACGLLENVALADASNDDEVSDDAEITVKCPTISLEKENDTTEAVLPGAEVTYTLTLTVSDGPANDVMVVDELPLGIEYVVDSAVPTASYDAASHTLTWDLGDLADGKHTLTYGGEVAADAEHGDELVNVAVATSPNSQCPSAEELEDECEAESSVLVRVPTLVIDKVASTETITISGPSTALAATPSVVTWTLSYTLTNGPVTDAVITDQVPVGFTFLDAANGGTFADGTVTWNLGTVTASGSVSFRTTVNPATISRTAPTVNTAVIRSNETPEDQGQDSVRVVVSPPPLAGNPTPTPRPLPDTATGIGIGGEPVTVPIELLAALFLGSLGAVALANVRARNRRR